MGIQYVYALLTMLPCPIWFWYGWASTAFLVFVFIWSVHNGATYYIDIFGTRFQRELEALKRDVTKWQNTPDLGGITPGALSADEERSKRLSISVAASDIDAKDETGEGSSVGEAPKASKSKDDVERIPLLADDPKEIGNGTARETMRMDGSIEGLRERK